MASVKNKVVKPKAVKAQASNKAVKSKSLEQAKTPKKTGKVEKAVTAVKAPKAIKPVKAKVVDTPIVAKQNESQIMKAVAEETGLKLADVKEVLNSLNALLSRHMKKRGSGEFKFPKLGVKVRRIRKPATKARIGRNPATGEEIKIAAKPARSVVKASALKVLKEMIDQ